MANSKVKKMAEVEKPGKRKNSSVKKTGLKEFIREYLENASEPFSFSHIIDQVRKHSETLNPKPEEHIRRLLRDSEKIGEIAERDRLYVPARQMFNKALILTCPESFEIDKQTLILGERFRPYVNPSNKQNTFFYNGVELEQRSLTEFLEEDDHFLENPVVKKFFHNLILDYSGDFSFSDPDCFMVINLSAIIKKSGLRSGDYLSFRLEDYDKGILSVTKCEPRELFPAKAEMTKLYTNFENFVNHEINETGLFPTLSKAILNFQSSIAKPAGSGPDYLPDRPELILNLNKLSVREFYGTSYLTKKDTPLPEFIGSCLESVMICDGRCEDLEDWLDSMNTCLSLSVFNAYVLDEHNSGKGDFTQLLGRIADKNDMAGRPEVSDPDFIGMYNYQVGEVLRNSGNLPASPDLNKSRRLMLMLWEELMDVVVTIGEKEKNLPVIVNHDLNNAICEAVSIFDQLEETGKKTESVQDIKDRILGLRELVKDIKLNENY